MEGRGQKGLYLKSQEGSKKEYGGREEVWRGGERDYFRD